MLLNKSNYPLRFSIEIDHLRFHFFASFCLENSEYKQKWKDPIQT